MEVLCDGHFGEEIHFTPEETNEQSAEVGRILGILRDEAWESGEKNEIKSNAAKWVSWSQASKRPYLRCWLQERWEVAKAAEFGTEREVYWCDLLLRRCLWLLHWQLRAGVQGQKGVSEDCDDLGKRCWVRVRNWGVVRSAADLPFQNRGARVCGQSKEAGR